MALSLLLVEDDDGIAAPLTRALAREGYDVDRVVLGQDALDRLRSGPPAIVVLDLGLPDMDGLDVCRIAREEGVAAQILILTARGDELDRVVGLDAGADDYLPKPFGLAELLARVRALGRRAATASPAAAPPPPSAPPTPSPAALSSAVGSLRVDEAAHRAWSGTTELQLSTKEFGVLALLHREWGHVVTREQLMEEVWDEHWFGSTKTLDVTLGRLRQKLTEAGATVRIVAVRGVGFRLEGPDA